MVCCKQDGTDDRMAHAVIRPVRRPHIGLITDRAVLLGNWTTRGYANSRTGHLADWSTRGLDNSRTRQLADWTSRGLDNSRSRRCRQKGKLSTQSRRWHSRVVQSATCPVRELSSPRVVQSASWQSASWQSASCPVTSCHLSRHSVVPSSVSMTVAGCIK